MSPTDRFRLPFRWHFHAVRNERDQAVHWRWTMLDYRGEILHVSPDVFDTLTECKANARTHGFTE